MAKSQPDNSYTDLAAGGSLRIVVPLVKSGGYRVATESTQEDGNTIALSAPDLAGYEIANYVVVGARSGKVRLRFTSAQITMNGNSVQQPRAPALPFALPRKAQHIRLIYLIRNSQSDHNMAIAASESLDTLNMLTEQIKSDPEACKRHIKALCSWVPAGIAVIPEPVAELQ